MSTESLSKQRDKLCSCDDTASYSPAKHCDLAATIEAPLGAAEQTNEAET